MNRNSEMEKIYRAFEEYIRNQNYFDIVYSEKLGYLRILVQAPEEGAAVLDSAEKMLEYLSGDIISDVVYSPLNPKENRSDLTLTEHEKTESLRRLSEFFGKLDIDEEGCRALAEKYLKRYEGGEEGADRA